MNERNTFRVYETKKSMPMIADRAISAMQWRKHSDCQLIKRYTEVVHGNYSGLCKCGHDQFNHGVLIEGKGDIIVLCPGDWVWEKGLGEYGIFSDEMFKVLFEICERRKLDQSQEAEPAKESEPTITLDAPELEITPEQHESIKRGLEDGGHHDLGTFQEQLKPEHKPKGWWEVRPWNNYGFRIFHDVDDEGKFFMDVRAKTGDEGESLQRVCDLHNRAMGFIKEEPTK